MTRFRIYWLPRVDFQAGADADDQRWTLSPDVFTGTPAECDEELRQLTAAYDGQLVFEARPLPVMPEDEPDRWCGSCGGDLRERLGHELACRCPLALVKTRAPAAVEVAS